MRRRPPAHLLEQDFTRRLRFAFRLRELRLFALAVAALQTLHRARAEACRGLLAPVRRLLLAAVPAPVAFPRHEARIRPPRMLARREAQPHAPPLGWPCATRGALTTI